MKEPKKKIKSHLEFLYNEKEASWVATEIRKLVKKFRKNNPTRAARKSKDFFTEKDAVLITYGDQIQTSGEKPLRTLNDFLTRKVDSEFNTIHLLPFFPYSSDAGFAITDYRSVNSALGDWNDIENIKERFNLMVDAVINHASRENKWFKEFMDDNPEFKDFFIEVDDSWDLSRVVRPRDNHLITETSKTNTSKRVWTTFSSDQVDLNYANPRVLLKIIDLLLFYIEKGAEVIRLDAIAYLWKKSGTTCIHLEETHRVIKLFRAVLDIAAPQVALITETNVPHEENISYFGSDGDEAQMVYQFTLPPLVLDAFIREDSSKLVEWADDLEYPDSESTFFNFLASHDGIGLRPAEGILPKVAIDRMVKRTKKHGGYISYKSDSDGSKSPYELNITYFDALSDPQGKESIELQVSRFMSSQAIMLAFQGVPGVYFHSLVGSRNYQQGVEETGQKRTINREKFTLRQIEKGLTQSNSVRKKVFERFKSLLQIRRKEKAFHPSANQRVLDPRPEVFTLLRSPEDSADVLCLHNVTGDNIKILPGPELLQELDGSQGSDLLTGEQFDLLPQGEVEISMEPYQVLWLKII